MRRVKVGFVGAGVHAVAVHYPSLAMMRDVEIAAVCDLKEERVRLVRAKFGVKKGYRDYRRMLSEEDLDAVYVITPPHQLYDIVADVLEMGLNVFIEKPPGVTRFQIESLARIAERNKCITMVGFNRRFIPLLRVAREAVMEEGEINTCVAEFHKYYPESLAYYRGAVDILTCDAIHAVDVLRWICGEHRRVLSIVKRFGRPYENGFYALIEFEGGRVGVLLADWASGGRVHRFELHTMGASAYVDPDDKALIYKDGSLKAVITTQEAAGSDDRVIYYGFYHENRHFIDCVKEGREPEISFREAVKTMKLVENIYREALRLDN
ncbi:MAG: gfo/Idh/MocA family oxidoreductase [Thermoprotei archaeon]|nr:MAG: gfo/Idh/MocA family oxidoreductase [Thermoprotei archaeon]